MWKTMFSKSLKVNKATESFLVFTQLACSEQRTSVPKSGAFLEITISCFPTKWWDKKRHIRLVC